MASVDAIKKDILTENDIYIEWARDIQMFEETYLYARELVEQMMDKGGEEACENFSNGNFSIGNLPKTVNTYPFGKKIKNVYREFIGVCAGKQKLNGLFSLTGRNNKLDCKKMYIQNINVLY